ncbi:Fructose-bisphosphate aldolase 5 [Durusdinium trenchii]|uniref:Fructose-bisphosphate aldolase n=1 Tax=Durusdinium trenchii TaxID=1381693 RepID=A0ABP0I4W7_9DINO
MGNFDKELVETAQKIASPGKGLLAADESIGTIGKRFDKISVENTHENRRKYRQLLFEAKGLGEFCSGCICFEETLYEKTPEGKSFIELLQAENIIPGIKVDKGQASIMGAAEGETSTQGLDGLGARCAEYYKQGARFAKWRAVIKINAETGAPTELAIEEQTRGLARYASICQENGLCPIVEPEVLMDGAHDIEVSAAVTERVWQAQFKALADHHVLLEGCILKPNMVRSGADNASPASMAEVAAYTVRTLQRTVPPAVPGITFLSGGMSEEEATVALNEINKCAGKKPWNLSFSYGRALQATVLQEWKGEDANIEAAQAALLLRAKANSLAQLGKYTGEAAGGAAADESTYQKNYSY